MTSPPTDADGWLRTGEDQLDDWLSRGTADLSVPSLLPGWTRAQVVAHLIGNATALSNLVTWARTGVETPMYADTDSRAAQIDADATRPAGWLRDESRARGRTLLQAFGELTDAQRAVRVRTAQGRDRTAAEIAWMRTRESAIHLVDLDLGFDFGDLSAALVDALLDDVTTTIGAKPGCPSLELVPSDRQRRWTLGHQPPGRTITGAAADLLRWVSGRPPAIGDSLSARPALPNWL